MNINFVIVAEGNTCSLSCVHIGFEVGSKCSVFIAFIQNNQDGRVHGKGNHCFVEFVSSPSLTSTHYSVIIFCWNDEVMFKSEVVSVLFINDPLQLYLSLDYYA